MSNEVMLVIRYAPVCGGYMVVWGRTVQDAQIIDIDGRCVWQSRRELVSALKAKGLCVSKSNEVTVCKEESSNV